MENWWHLLWDNCRCFKNSSELCRTNWIPSNSSVVWIISSPWKFQVSKFEQFLRTLCYRCRYSLWNKKKAKLIKERGIKTCDFQNRISNFLLLEHWLMCQANFDLKISSEAWFSPETICCHDGLISETRINTLFHKIFLPSVSVPPRFVFVQKKLEPCFFEMYSAFQKG